MHFCIAENCWRHAQVTEMVRPSEQAEKSVHGCVGSAFLSRESVR